MRPCGKLQSAYHQKETTARFADKECPGKKKKAKSDVVIGFSRNVTTRPIVVRMARTN